MITISKLKELCEKLEHDGHGERKVCLDLMTTPHLDGALFAYFSGETIIDPEYNEVDFVLIGRIV